MPNELYVTKSLLDQYQIDLIIFSGGGNPVNPENNGDLSRLNVEKFLLKKSVSLSIPIIGVCRGAQSIVCQQGGEITLSSRHVANMHKIFFDLNPNFNLTVNSFHNFVIERKNYLVVFIV